MATRGAMRASSIIRQAPKSSDPFKYTATTASPFWEKFRKAMVLNPDSNSGVLIADEYRYPPPGSRPEVYSLPPSKASDIAQNAYYERDFRRAYPKLDVVTQTELSALLLAQPEQLNLPAPNTSSAVKASEGTTDVATIPSPTPSLASLYYASSESSQVSNTSFTASKLPPKPAASIKVAWKPSKEKIERDPYTYFPMDTYSSTVVEQKASFGHDTERTGVSNDLRQ
ncbi:21 kDa subunit of NADH dehydrogenase [Cystobasidium minutum MCA 4210]|uniref:21 kDa subunit of NADH dehydrogenase n=1 Tax=Cystobasidium minutum MCA 4210 TaxID=1397322 RepID=UPI0034CDB9F4|eukprot:jgi/Rhomi1/150455/estExt_Genewise1.C_2_t30256